jgi:hypothetical protein
MVSETVKDVMINQPLLNQYHEHNEVFCKEHGVHRVHGQSNYGRLEPDWKSMCSTSKIAMTLQDVLRLKETEKCQTKLSIFEVDNRKALGLKLGKDSTSMGFLVFLKEEHFYVETIDSQTKQKVRRNFKLDENC